MHIKDIQLVSKQVLAITWSDDHESIYFAPHLRKQCPCARCAQQTHQKAEQTPFNILPFNTDNAQFESFHLVGRYAVGIHFSDGHKTGMYTYEKLRLLCQCDRCADDLIRIQGPLR